MSLRKKVKMEGGKRMFEKRLNLEAEVAELKKEVADLRREVNHFRERWDFFEETWTASLLEFGKDWHLTTPEKLIRQRESRS